MNSLKKKLTSLITALTVAVTALPILSSTVSADGLEKRDPFYSYSKGYNYYESEHFRFIWGIAARHRE